MRADLRDRIGAASGALALQALLLLGLIFGLQGVRPARPAADPLALVEVPAAPPPEVKPRPEPRRARMRDAAAPANLRARATDIVVPPPVLALSTPILAAPIVDSGADAMRGASDLPGPGSGAGGRGDGRGGGGDGDGGGGTPPRHVRGSLRNSDYPRAAAEAGAGGTVGVRYRVGTDGRVGACLVTRSSGNDALDAATCSLIERRFRFAPARDEAGRPVASTIVENHSWFVEPAEPGSARREED